MEENTVKTVSLSEYDSTKKTVSMLQDIIVIINECIETTVREYCRKACSFKTGERVKILIGSKKEYSEGILVDISVNFETNHWIYKVQLITKDGKVSQRIFTNITDIKHCHDNDFQDNCMVGSTNEESS